MQSQSWEGNLAAGSLHFLASLELFLTTSSVSRAQNWQKSLFRHSAKELRSGWFQIKLSGVGRSLCSERQKDGTMASSLGRATDTSSLEHITAFLWASVSSYSQRVSPTQVVRKDRKVDESSGFRF